MPPQNAAENASPTTNVAGDASSKKYKISNAETEGESEDNTLPDFNQAAKENNPRNKDNKNNSLPPTVSFYNYGRCYGRC